MSVPPRGATGNRRLWRAEPNTDTRLQATGPCDRPAYEDTCHITWCMTVQAFRDSATASAGADAHSQSPYRSPSIGTDQITGRENSGKYPEVFYVSEDSEDVEYSHDVPKRSLNVFWDSEDVLKTSPDVRGDSEDVPQTPFNVRRDSDDMLKTSFNVCRDSEYGPKTSSNVRRDSEDVPKTSSNVHQDSEDVPNTSFNVRRDSEDVPNTSATVHGEP
ncbi:unnamed protein product [Heligmosomoides polygyrus]|uniref:Linker for activation of T-cells family member 2 n=1 Tax=Heligmosomoides polygyrus TaxID=6339 RepID=A0A3P8EMV4_HELPZ|nr:unnamed protein product [Heligmosomoides polygyrus]